MSSSVSTPASVRVEPPSAHSHSHSHTATHHSQSHTVDSVKSMPSNSSSQPSDVQSSFSPSLVSLDSRGAPSSLLSILGLLRNLHSLFVSSTLAAVFTRLNLSSNTWSLLRRSALPLSEWSVSWEQMLESIRELLRRVRRRGLPPLASLVDTNGLNEELNQAYRVYTRSQQLYATIFKHLTPAFHELESELESRGHLPIIDLKFLYPSLKSSLDRMFADSDNHAHQQHASTDEAQPVEHSSSDGTVASAPPCSSPLALPLSTGGVSPRSPRMQRSERRERMIEAEQQQQQQQQELQEEENQRSTPGHSTSLAVSSLSSPIGSPSPACAPAPSSAVPAQLDVESSALPSAARASLDSDEEQSEEEPEIDAHTDIFSKLFISKQTNEKQTKRKLVPPTLPRLDFLSQYMIHHSRAFSALEGVIDSYLLCLLSSFTTLSIVELLHKRDVYAQIVVDAHHLASHFIRFALPLIDRVLQVEPTFLADNIMQLSMKGIEKGVHYSDARQLIRKCRLLHQLFSSLDIYMFPRFLAAHKGGCKCVHIAHIDAAFALTAGYDQTLRIWDINQNRCLAQFVGHTSIVTWCHFSQLDTWCASASFDGSIRIWNARTAELIRVLSGHEDAVLDCDMGYKDKVIASASMDCTVRLWAVQTGKCTRILRGHKHWVKTVKFANEGQTVISAGLDKQILIWHVRSGDGSAPRHVLQHANFVLDLLVVSNSRFISTSKDKSIRLWDMRSGKLEESLENPTGSTALTLAMSPDASMVAAGLFDNSISIYETESWELKRQLKVHNDGILCVRWVTNRTLIVGTACGNVQIINI